jgi:hypothetical protein
MRILAKVYIWLSIALGALAILGSFTSGDGYEFLGGALYVGLAVVAIRFINITENYEKVTKEMAEEDRINKLVEQKLQERE